MPFENLVKLILSHMTTDNHHAIAVCETSLACLQPSDDEMPHN